MSDEASGRHGSGGARGPKDARSWFSRASGGPCPRIADGGYAIGFVGLGRAGTALAVALEAAGHPVTAVVVRGREAAVRAAGMLPGAKLVGLVEAPSLCDVLFLTVTDDAIAPLVGDLVPHVRSGLVVAHVSGRHGLGVLRPLVERGASGLAFHPVMTLANDSAVTHRRTGFAGVTFGVTADEPALAVAETLVADLGGRLERVVDEARVTYHAALAIGANQVASLVLTAANLLAKAGVSDPGAALRPLVAASVDNVLRAGARAMTGPVARGDAGTVEAHLAALAATDPSVVEVYVDLASLTVRHLRTAGLASAAEEERLTVLADVLEGWEGWREARRGGRGDAARAPE